MALEISIKSPQSVPVEVEGITPDAVASSSRTEVEQMPIYLGNQSLVLADLFEVSGDPSDGQMHWHGDLSGVHWIGAKMQSGQIHVHGSAGRHVGSEMTGGSIRVDGDAGDWVGGEMHGGQIEITGSAGHLIGSAYRGSKRGMTGGTILIHGDVGNEIGHTMRRGLLAVGGRAGDIIGFSMLAGTIVVLGETGIRHGAGMKRGTLVLLQESPVEMLPTFAWACQDRPVAWLLILRDLLRIGLAVPEQLRDQPIAMYHGDALTGSRGEIWLRSHGCSSG